MMRLSANKLGDKECYTAQVGRLWLGFSYQTCIAARFEGSCVRRTNEWGQTTGRHITALDVRGYPEVSEEELSAFVTHALYEMGKQHPLNMLGA